MACCCQSASKENKSATSCLGRCDLPKHRCLDKEDVKPGPVPKYMGWRYTAKDAPKHQLRCGWRPGHIACPVLRKIESHNCEKTGDCSACTSRCFSSCHTCSKSCCATPKCLSVCPPTPSCCRQPCGPQNVIRIVRHAGNYTISTKPSNISNAPSGPYPLKYVINTDNTDPDYVGSNEPGAKTPKAKYSVEAKYNDNNYDYTSSQSSFVLEFSPLDCRPPKSCCKSSSACKMCRRPC